MLPVLLLTEHNEAALYYTDHCLNNYQYKHTNIEPGLYQSVDLCMALALIKSKRKTEALKLYQDITLSNFYFLTKKSDMILYLFLNKYLKKNKIDTTGQIVDLIDLTGFRRLNRLIDSTKIKMNQKA